jgi:hypothetical protein
MQYEEWTPTAPTLRTLAHANQIATDYADQGYNLTLRQLYYRFVAQDLIPNNQRSYKRLGDIVNKGRMAGYLDWEHIEDRTRNLRQLPTWSTPQSILRSARDSYREDLWADQPTAVEVWVEKDALVDVIGRAANAWDAPYFSCRGYVSQSEMWRAGQRILSRLTERGQTTLILHLGDHDPSGVDMSRDIRDRLNLFVMGDPALWAQATDAGEENPYTHYANSDLAWPGAFELRRIALTWDQIEEYEPPPNPAKLTDSRAAGYIEEYGRESWELDALEPQTLDALIRTEIANAVAIGPMEAARDRQEENRAKIAAAIEDMA